MRNFSDWIQYEKGLAKGTADAYLGDLQRFFHQSSATALSLSTQDLRAYLSELGRAKKEPSYLARVVSSFRAFFDYLVGWRKCGWIIRLLKSPSRSYRSGCLRRLRRMRCSG
ncbi:site-specific integrase [Rubritalea tangerina]|uniref:site-specific integrase n=1 Tax=Rubritalea tangerina TaxID=430798 RepID=UPI0036222A7D